MFWKGVPEEGDLILERQSWLHRLEDKRDSEETLDGGGGGVHHGQSCLTQCSMAMSLLNR